jgi:hypothetical protein
MTVDIRDDIPEVLAYVRRRVAEQAANAANRPVTMITLGFEFGNENWVALAFDTRPNPEPDGRWTVHVAKFLKRRPRWPNWGEKPQGERVIFKSVTGEEVDITDTPDDLGCKVIGDAMREVLLTARREGVFETLAKADHCELEVENFGGYFGWLASKDTGH